MPGFRISPASQIAPDSFSSSAAATYAHEISEACLPSTPSTIAKEEDDLPAYEAPMLYEHATPPSHPAVHAGDYVFYFGDEADGAIRLWDDHDEGKQSRSLIAKVLMFVASILMLFSMTFSLLGGLAVQTAHPAPREISDLFEIVALPLVDSFNVALLGTGLAFSQGVFNSRLGEAAFSTLHLTLSEAVPAYILAAYLHVKLTGFTGR